MRDVQIVQCLVHALANDIGRPAELQRSKRELIEDRGIEQLGIGILKHQAHTAAEIERERLILEMLFGERLPAEVDRTGFGKAEAIEKAQQGGFPRPIGPQQRDPLAGGDRQAYGVECDHVFVTVGDVFDLKDHF